MTSPPQKACLPTMNKIRSIRKFLTLLNSLEVIIFDLDYSIFTSNLRSRVESILTGTRKYHSPFHVSNDFLSKL